MNKSLLIVYHSGAGSTKTIAEIYCCLLENLCTDHQIHLTPISDKGAFQNIQEYDLIILGFPTYHSEPPASMKEFAEEMPPMNTPQKLFLFTTYGLYPANSLRIIGKQLKKKNYLLCGTAGYRGPATDAALLLPKISPLLVFGKKTASRLVDDLLEIKHCLEGGKVNESMPRFKLYSLLNYPNQYFGKRVKHKLQVAAEDCIHCQQCIKGCFRDCWKPGNAAPIFDPTHCEHCFRCIHHCPESAIILSRKTKTRVKLTPSFYSNKKELLLAKIHKMIKE
ncbi:MAG: 4Fe-4S ferredoxin [Tindallia sp. MSAO_Bac2]|nr:MAG: 4Fe-4S ferredoxin [Tindallia sp. MSAO_Bac2]